MPKATLKSLREEVAGLNTAILTLEDELNTYRTQNTSLRTEIQDRSDESDRQILRLQQNLKRVTNNFNNLVAKYNKKSVELDNLEARYNEKSAEVDNLVARYNELSFQLDSCKKKSNNRLGQVILLKAKLQQEKLEQAEKKTTSDLGKSGNRFSLKNRFFPTFPACFSIIVGRLSR